MIEATKPLDQNPTATTDLISDLTSELPPECIKPIEPIPQGRQGIDAETEAVLSEFADTPAQAVFPSQAIPDKIEQPDEPRPSGRPPGSKNKPRSVIYEEVPQVDYALLSSYIFDTGTSSLASLFGPEWMARNEDEKKGVCLALANYMKANQMPDIPPGVMLCIVLAAYSAPRLREPSTASKLSAGWHWIRSKFSRRSKIIPLPQTQAL